MPKLPHVLLLAVAATAVLTGCAGEDPTGRRAIQASEEDIQRLAQEPIAGEVGLETSLTQPAEGSYALVVEVQGVTLVPPAEGLGHVPGEGHLRVAVDGEVVAETHERTVPLTLDRPPHRVSVELVTNDGRRYAVSGVPLRASLEVPAG